MTKVKRLVKRPTADPISTDSPAIAGKQMLQGAGGPAHSTVANVGTDHMVPHNFSSGRVVTKTSAQLAQVMAQQEHLRILDPWSKAEGRPR